jgi:hypothetical protein
MPPKTAKSEDYSHPMRRLINALLAFFLPALVCLTVRAVEELPSWAIKAFNEKLSARYELVQKMEPSFFNVGKKEAERCMKQQEGSKLLYCANSSIVTR